MKHYVYLDKFNKIAPNFQPGEPSKSLLRRVLSLSGAYDHRSLLYLSAHRGIVPKDFTGPTQIDEYNRLNHVIDLDSASPDDLLSTFYGFLKNLGESPGPEEIDDMFCVKYLPPLDENGRTVDIKNISSITFAINRYNSDALLCHFLLEMQDRGFLPEGDIVTFAADKSGSAFIAPVPSIPAPDNF